ncbi:cupin domain-containing protein [Helicobacter sp. L8]|uniref:cupin domain-containing protein n=1 Tax=Helicobacter sp. L8 TaxID=2316078 RepID=UPI000EACFADB|nr:cupin domain-containing protein [Helicobacter sp. L8]
MQEIHRQADFKHFQGANAHFSGHVEVTLLFTTNQWRNFSGALVKFAPKARSAWHTHPAGQTLIVTEGEIYTGTAEGKVSVAHKGEVISCPIGVKHWHGAGLHKGGAHLALTGDKEGQNVQWLEKLSDAEYTEAIKTLAHNSVTPLQTFP